jgi:hypothetical protein
MSSATAFTPSLERFVRHILFVYQAYYGEHLLDCTLAQHLATSPFTKGGLRGFYRSFKTPLTPLC